MDITKILRDITQQPQRQDSTEDQLRSLIAVANRLGCYDAADAIAQRLDGPPEPDPEVVTFCAKALPPSPGPAPIASIRVKHRYNEDFYSLKCAREGSTYTIMLTKMVRDELGGDVRFKGLASIRELVENIGVL